MPELVRQNTRAYHRIGEYEVLAHLATGGMGVIYRARHHETGQEVALKVLSPGLAAKPVALERFRREARQGAKLRHPNLVGIYEFAEANGLYFVAQEYVEGIDLHEYITHLGKVEAREAFYFLRQGAQVLDYLHSQQVVHRDIKPANFLVTEFEDRLIIKLTDFGLARDVNEEDFRVTRAGNTVGTIDYMAPEQARDSGAADIRSDIYALGCTLYHMLAGHPPFAEGGLTERLYRHAEADPPDVRRSNPDVTDDMVCILLQMLAKKPADRYQTPAQLLEDLDRLDSGERPAATTKVKLPTAKRASAADDATSLPDISNRITEFSIQAYPQNLAIPDADVRAAPEAEALALVSEEDAQAAASQYAIAQRSIASNNLKEASQLLLGCCLLDPTNLAYRQALRKLTKRRLPNGTGAGWIIWLRTFALKARLKAAQQEGEHARVLSLGEQILMHNPTDAGTQIDMADASESLGLAHVATWILEQAWRNDTHNAALNRALAQLYEKHGSYKVAAALWKMVLRADPTDGEAHRKTADLAARETIARGRYEENLETRLEG
jgi:serine/threonine protein kinase